MALNSKFAGFVLTEGPARMTLMSPWNSEPIVRNDNSEECWIELHFPHSEHAKALERRLLDKALRRRTARPSVKDVQEAVCERLAGLTKAWCLGLPDGTPVDEPCTTENALAFYTDVIWMREQVSVFLNDLGNFRKTPSESSSTSLSTSSDSAA